MKRYLKVISEEVPVFLNKYSFSRVAYTTADDFAKDECISIAASISFYFLLSFIPFLILAGGIAGFIIDYLQDIHNLTNEEIITASMNFLSTVFPSIQEQTIREFFSISNYKTTLGAIGLVSLILSSSMLFSVFKFAFYKIYKAKKTNIIAARLFGMLFIVTAVIFLFFLQYLYSLFVPILQSLAKQNIILENAVTVVRSDNVIVPFLVTSLSILVILYLFITVFARKSYIMFKSIFFGSLFFTLLWSTAKELFNYYLAQLSNVNIMYGSITWIITMILWVYYSSIIFLLTLEFIKNLNDEFQKRALASLFFASKDD